MHMIPGRTHDHGHDHSHATEETNKFEVKLKSKQEVAEGTMAFHFERPEGLVFKAGQHIDITLINPPETDAEGNNRSFSLVNAPSESDLVIATRMRDTAFKRVLKDAPVGTVVRLEGPFGSFTLHADSTKPAVFLIGGIGITPVMSILKDATERNLSHSLLLMYSNRKPEDAAFLEQLQNLVQVNSKFTFVPTMTESDKSSQQWHGETGYIDEAMVKKYVPNIQAAIYYLSGPPAMVGAMRKLLTALAVSEDNIKTEEFSGY